MCGVDPLLSMSVWAQRILSKPERKCEGAPVTNAWGWGGGGGKGSQARHGMARTTGQAYGQDLLPNEAASGVVCCGCPTGRLFDGELSASSIVPVASRANCI